MLKREDLLGDIASIAKILPPFPKIVLQLLETLHDENSSLEAVAQLARNDPVISGNILALANHLRRLRAQSDLSDPYAAASLIGINQVRRVVINAGMNQLLGNHGNSFFFNHSLAVAITSQELATLCGVSPDEAYIAGILHDVGQLCFYVVDDQAFQNAYQQSITDGKLLEREAALFGLNHCQIGAKLAHYWKLPEEILSAIETHHDESIVTSRLQAVVTLGETLARALDMPTSPRNRVLGINSKAVEHLDIDWGSAEMLDCFGRCRARFLGNARHFSNQPA